ncbi:MAG: PAS domain-containing protein [Candidatus Omnitrophica bacterium]|nr:PAS domain-containing protein [Candidatus Omnitrophota bacterium]
MSVHRNAVLPDKGLLRIVCVGASAGGLESFRALLEALPKRTDHMAFVLVQHLEPHHKSALADIISRGTSLTVAEAKNNVKVEPSSVYVIPPNKLISISRGRLKVTGRLKRADGKYLPVDHFMISLAREKKENAVGVILSGTGSDGTEGAKAIKANGGTVFAQDESSSAYFGMPESVIKSGYADLVLEPKDIARELAGLGAHGRGKFIKHAAKVLAGEDALKKVLVLLRDRTGIDFPHYKAATITRRVGRRMSALNIGDYAGYYDHLRSDPAEADLLRKDILIPVTSFFRDPKLFEALKKKVSALIPDKRSNQNPVRLWVPACSTGEEVYSLAIFLYEFMEARRIKPHIQVFGTDLSEAHIGKARAGSYAGDIAGNVSPGRLNRFFIRTETGYKIAKHIRDKCIFARHDITSDPPLSNMDIVSCRNLLIYLDVFLQEKALSMIHYALKPKGFLILGTSESAAAVPDLFTAVDKKEKIYSKNVLSRKKALDVGTLMPAAKNRPYNAGRTARPGKNPVRAPVASAGEEKDALNEELRAANEEIQSSNEELQSMNEELETSKEELQSTNEELLSLNDELQGKNSDLTDLNNDLSNFFSSTNIPIIIVGNDQRIKRFTPAARKVMNLIPADVGRPIGDIRPNIDIADLEEIIRSVLADMIPKESEVKDKEGRWYSVRIRPYRTVDNRIDGAVIAVIDIDDTKRSREEVQGVLDYNQAIIETMREPMVVLDKDMRVVSANKSFYDAFKVREYDVKDRLFYQLGGREWENPELRKLLVEGLASKGYFNDFEMTFDFPGIGNKTMILNGRNIKLHGKESSLILLAMEDITKRKRAEEVLKRDKETLDKLIAKRTRELLALQVKLVRSRHLAAVGALAATVAHELRNPLADIALSVHRIKKLTKDPLKIKILSGISGRVFESDQIINNILMYSKTPITNYETVRINDILRSSIGKVTEKYPTRKISTTWGIDPTKDLFIDADPVRMKEVFQNVLHNAVESVSEGEVMINVVTQVSGAKVTVRIKDNGEGMSRKDLKNISNPFFTTKTKGTGLGLAVCKQVVMLHGGAITFKSAPGKGTTVAITLPKQKRINGKKHTDS